MYHQGHSRHVWDGQVHKHATARGGWGHAPLENFWNLEAKRLPLRPFLGQCNAPRRPDRSLISQATPFADEPGLRDYNRCLEERKGVEEFCRTVRSHPTSLNMLPVCLLALCGCPPSNGAIWRCQASQSLATRN